MAKYFNEQQILHSHGGYLWFNQKMIAALRSVQIKITDSVCERYIVFSSQQSDESIFKFQYVYGERMLKYSYDI